MFVPEKYDYGKKYESAGEALLPDFDDAPRVNFEIGVAVAEQAVVEGSAQAWGCGEGEQAADGEEKGRIIHQVREIAANDVWVRVCEDEG